KRKFDADMDSVVNDYQSAIDAFDRYFEIEGPDKTKDDYDDIADPEFVKPDQAYLFRAIAKISKANEEGAAGQSGLYQSAIADAEKVLEFDEASVTAIYQKGVAQRMMGNLEGAADTFTDALKMAPQFGDALLRRGIVYYYLNELESARGDFHNVIANSEIPDGRADFWIGVSYAKEGNFDEAIRMYTRTIRLNPAYKPAYNNRGLALMKLGRYDRAARDFEELIRRDRNDSVARQRRDMARQMMNQQR
ncbi:MAG: tetratricopeptide repeat protein, partial [Planctomycetota bacterium]